MIYSILTSLQNFNCGKSSPSKIPLTIIFRSSFTFLNSSASALPNQHLTSFRKSPLTLTESKPPVSSIVGATLTKPLTDISLPSYFFCVSSFDFSYSDVKLSTEITFLSVGVLSSDLEVSSVLLVGSSFFVVSIVVSIVGDVDLEVISAAGLDIADAGGVTFLANLKYTPQIKDTRASAIFLNENVKIEREDIAVLRAKDAYLAYTRALRLFNPKSEIVPSIHPSAIIDETAAIAESVEIMANVVVGKNCEIHENVKIYPNATIYDGVKIGAYSVIHSGVSVRENCEIGKHCTIHNNTTIGSDGFGYAKDENKKWLKIPQIGRVVLED